MLIIVSSFSFSHSQSVCSGLCQKGIKTNTETYSAAAVLSKTDCFRFLIVTSPHITNNHYRRWSKCKHIQHLSIQFWHTKFYIKSNAVLIYQIFSKLWWYRPSHHHLLVYDWLSLNSLFLILRSNSNACSLSERRNSQHSKVIVNMTAHIWYWYNQLHMRMLRQTQYSTL